MRARPGLPEPCHGAIDELRIYRPQVVPAISHAVHGTGLEVLDHDVGILHQAMDHFLRVRMFQVEGYGALARIGAQINSGIFSGLKPVIQWIHLTALIADARLFDLHDIRAHQG